MKHTIFLYAIIVLFVFTQCKKEETNTPNDLPVMPIPEANLEADMVAFYDNFENVNLILIGSKDIDYMMAFNRTLADGTLGDFEALQNELPLVMQDSEGNKWDVFGTAIEGPRTGETLSPVVGYRGYFFAWGAFYPNTEIYGETPLETPPDMPTPNNDDWLVNNQNVKNGGPPKDGIPALTEPEFLPVADIDYLSDGDLVAAIKVGEEVKVYPYNILDWHEIINDKIDDNHFSIIYCPLTGTATNWNRNLSTGITTFGVSGLVYNSNVVPYDRASDSNWSQIRNACINGELMAEIPENQTIVELNWITCKTLYPNAKVVSSNTGHSRDYANYPYGDYRTNTSIYFSLDNKDERLHEKERVYGVTQNNKAKVYQLSNF